MLGDAAAAGPLRKVTGPATSWRSRETRRRSSSLPLPAERSGYDGSRHGKDSRTYFARPAARAPGSPDVAALGDAMHGFLAADSTVQESDARLAMADRLMVRWGVAGPTSSRRPTEERQEIIIFQSQVPSCVCLYDEFAFRYSTSNQWPRTIVEMNESNLIAFAVPAGGRSN